MTAPFQALVLWQERCRVMVQPPVAEQQVPTGQVPAAQVEPKPCQMPRPHCPMADEPGAVMVQAKGLVVLLQHAPTQGVAVQVEPLPMYRKLLSMEGQLAEEATRVQTPLLAQHAPEPP